MPAHNAMAISNEFISRSLRDGISVTQMKLQKLVFLANGWNWVVNSERLIEDTPYAWKFGPVYPALYEHAKLFGKKPITRVLTSDDDNKLAFFGVIESNAAPFKTVLTDRETAVLDQVWSKYGELDAYTLSDLTHAEGTPWSQAYYGQGKRSVISQKSIAAHYEDLAAKVAA